MKISLEFLSEKLDDIVFFNLKRDIKISGKIILDKEVPIPLMIASVKDKLNDSDPEFTQNEIIDGIVFLLGLDNKFKHKSYYKEILLNIDENSLEKIANQILMDIIDANKISSFIKLVGINNLGFENDLLYLNIARLAFEIDQVNKNKNYILISKIIFEKLMNSNEELPLPYYYMGYYYYNKGDYSKAKEFWEIAMDKGLPEEHRSDLVEIFHKLEGNLIYEKGYKLILNGRYDEGLEKLLSLKDEYDQWWNLYFFIGLGYRFKQEYDRALHYFEYALNLNSTNVDIMNEIGICHTLNGNNEIAIEVYNKALELKPENYEILCNLGIVYLNTGDDKTAEIYIKKAFELNPKDEVTAKWMQHIKSNKSIE